MCVFICLIALSFSRLALFPPSLTMNLMNFPDLTPNAHLDELKRTLCFPHALEGFFEVSVWRPPLTNFTNMSSTYLHILSKHLLKQFINHSLVGYLHIEETKGHALLAQSIIVHIESRLHFVAWVHS